MQISALNIVSFKYSGPNISMALKNVPRLREVSLGGYYGCFLVNNFCQLSSYISPLETLKLDLSLKQFTSFPRFPKLRNLKQLELTLSANGCHSLLHCKSFLKASPLLDRLVLKLERLDDVCKQEKVKVRKAKRPFRCLKVVELVGFVGCTIDVELALYILKNSVSLEKIIIDPRCPDDETGWDFRGTEKKLAAKTWARQLETSLPSGVELVIPNVL